MSELVRALRRRDLTGLLLNAMMGAGMLAAPARVFGLVGDWGFVVLFASAAIILPLILCFADLGSRYTGAGGPYLYARRTLAPWLSFLVGWLLWISQGLGIATLSNLLMSYLAGFSPALADGLPRVAVILSVAVVLTVIVLVGIRQSARASNLLIVLKGAFVVGFLIAGAAWIQPDHLVVNPPAPAPIAFAQAILVYLFGYSGFERGAVVAGEASNPQHDVPAALLIGLALATLAYGAVLLICVGVLDNPAATDRPLAEVGRTLFGGAGQFIVSVGAVTVIVGTLLGLVLTMARLMMALAQHGQLPAALGRLHTSWRTPHWAVLASAVFGFSAALGSDLIGSLTFSTAARLCVYMLCCFALWRLTRTPDAPKPGFALPGAGGLALATIVLFAGVLALGATKELPLLAIVSLAGLILFAAIGGGRRAPSPDPQSTP